ncbi:MULTISPECIES: hypothetical protein [Priestia]|nr:MULTISPECIES: hypothetical protein [Priestia]WDC91237.1 hypothetical protein PSR56_27210 [Priestia megaterium]
MNNLKEKQELDNLDFILTLALPVLLVIGWVVTVIAMIIEMNK